MAQVQDINGRLRLVDDLDRVMLEINQSTGAVTDKNGSSIGGSALNSGTSFPGSPADGDWFYRTDRNILYFYKASITRWLSVDKQYGTAFGESQLMATSTVPNIWGRFPIFEDIYVETINVISYIGGEASGNNGSNYYTYAFSDAVGTIATLDTSADSPAVYYNKSATINAIKTSGTNHLLTALITKTGTPGLNYSGWTFTFRQAG